MRVAAQGKWFIQATNNTTGKKFFPFYNGFNTKKEAQEVCDTMNKIKGFTHEVVGK